MVAAAVVAVAVVTALAEQRAILLLPELRVTWALRAMRAQARLQEALEALHLQLGPAELDRTETLEQQELPVQPALELLPAALEELRLLHGQVKMVQTEQLDLQETRVMLVRVLHREELVAQRQPHGLVKMDRAEQLAQLETLVQMERVQRQAQLVAQHLPHGRVKMVPMEQRVRQEIQERLVPMAQLDLKALLVTNQHSLTLMRSQAL